MHFDIGQFDARGLHNQDRHEANLGGRFALKPRRSTVCGRERFGNHHGSLCSNTTTVPQGLSRGLEFGFTAAGNWIVWFPAGKPVVRNNTPSGR